MANSTALTNVTAIIAEVVAASNITDVVANMTEDHSEQAHLIMS